MTAGRKPLVGGCGGRLSAGLPRDGQRWLVAAAHLQYKPGMWFPPHAVPDAASPAAQLNGEDF